MERDICPLVPEGYEDAMDDLGYLDDSRAMKGAKSERKAEDQYLRKFFQEIDRAVSGHLAGSESPLILACVDRYAPMYHEISTYRHLSDEMISGNPEDRDLRDLADEARHLLRGELIESQKSRLIDYKQAKGNGLAVEGIEALLEAAEDGNLRSIFLPGDTVLWGHVSSEDGSVRRGDSDSLGQGDLYEHAALAALDAGSEVYFLEEAQLPTDGKVIGIRRWKEEPQTSAHAAAGVV